jgi:hypothetical protein
MQISDERHYIRAYHRPLDRLVGNGSLRLARIDQLPANETDIDSMKEYLTSISEKYRLVKSAAERRQEHYDKFIMNKKIEDPGHQSARELLNFYTDEAARILDHYQSQYDKLMKDFWDTQDAKDFNYKHNPYSTLLSSQKTVDNKSKPALKRIIKPMRYARHEVPDHLRSAEHIRNTIWMEDIDTFVNNLNIKDLHSNQYEQQIYNRNLQLAKMLITYMVNLNDLSVDDLSFSNHRTFYICRLIKAYPFNRKSLNSIGWLKQLDISRPDLLQLPYFNISFIESWYQSGCPPIDADKCSDLFVSDQILYYRKEIHKWFTMRERQLEDEMVTKIQNWQSKLGKIRTERSRYHRKSIINRNVDYYQCFADKYGSTYKDSVMYCYNLFLLCFIDRIPYRLYNQFLTHHIDKYISFPNDDLTEIEKNKLDFKPSLNYSRILRSFSSESLVLFGHNDYHIDLLQIYSYIYLIDKPNILNLIHEYVLGNVSKKKIELCTHSLCDYIDEEMLNPLDTLVEQIEHQRMSEDNIAIFCYYSESKGKYITITSNNCTPYQALLVIIIILTEIWFNTFLFDITIYPVLHWLLL